ncbi:MAG: extracellular solute-binding protein [Clostridiales bacterium]|nr:extracellular solute-binding protein [Clostridiales bacterium]
MLRYIIGITLLTLGIIIIRALSNGKIRRRYQYAFWIVIPLFMILMPFVKIDVPVADIWNTVFTSKTGTATYENADNVSPIVVAEDIKAEPVISDNQSVVNHEIQETPKIFNEHELMPENHAVISDITTNEFKKIDTILMNCGYLVSAVLIGALTAYNISFILYCKRNRNLIGRDPLSGLKIYSIGHKETPFLLFNKIYVDNDSEKISEYVICHEACHYKHGDYLWVLIRYLVLFLNWYNPVIWAAFILSGRDCELACDEEVLKVYGADSSKDYARTLLGMLQQQSNTVPLFTLSTGMKSGYEMMKKRIISIKRPANNRRKALALSMAAILLVTSCSFVNISKNVREVSANDPWWNDTETVISPNDIRNEGNKDFWDLHGNYFAADENSVILAFDIRNKDSNDSILRHYSYDGELLGQVRLSDYFGEGVVFYTPETLYKLNNKYYAVIRHYDDRMDSLVDAGYEIDFDNATLKNPFKIELPDDGSMFSNIITMTGVNDMLVYLMSMGDFDYHSYKICVVEGENTRFFVPEFGNDVQINYIGNLMKYGDDVSITAEITDNGRTKSLFCILDLDSFEMQVSETKENLNWVDYVPDCGIFECRDNKVVSRTISETEDDNVLADLHDTYMLGKFEDYAVVWAKDDTVVLFIDDQSPTGGMSTTRLIKLEKAAQNPNHGKKILSLAYIDWISKFEYGAINDFNRNSDKYFIEVTDKYYDVATSIYDNDAFHDDLTLITASEADAVDLLKADIREGDGPDIVIYRSDSAQLNSPDYLVDLTKRINSENSLNNGDYMEFVTEPNGRDGKHYRLDYGFNCTALMINNSFIDEGSAGLTFNQYDNIINERNAGKSILYDDNLALMRTLMKNSDSISFSKDGKLMLDNENFKATNEYIAAIPGIMPYDNQSWIQMKNMQIIEGVTFQSFVYLYGKAYKNYSITGLPSSDGHAEVISGRGIGITSCCTLQDAAWEFAMTMMSPDYQNQVNVYYDPVLKSAQKTAFESYIDINNARRNPYDASDIPISKDIVDYYIDQISDAVTVPDMDSGILVIMNEEMPAYYSGQKSLDDVIEIIENRVNLMLSEQG